jgi:hypothetical protein
MSWRCIAAFDIRVAHEIIKAVLGRESGHDFAKGCLVRTGCSILLSLLLSV